MAPTAHDRAARRLLAGRILTALPVSFLLFDTSIHLLNIDPVVDAFTRLGYPSGIAPAIGFVELLCLVTFLIPRTAMVGAVMLTGFLGGAIATHVRVGDPLVTHVFFPGYVALLLWAGLYPHDVRTRALLPMYRSKIRSQNTL